MRKLFVGFLLVIAIVAAVFVVQPATPSQALTVDLLTFASLTDLTTTCDRLQVGLNFINRRGNNNDGALDYYYVVVYDGRGNPHASDNLGAIVGSSGTVTIQIDETFYGNLAARPLRIAVYDVNVAGILPISQVEEFPVVNSTSFDPANYLPYCAVKPLAGDFRINPLVEDPYQPVAIYCEDNGRIDVYRINENSDGFLVLRASAEQIAAVGVQETNQLITASNDGEVRLYRLSTGEFQVNAPYEGNFDGYVYIWGGCSPTGQRIN